MPLQDVTVTIDVVKPVGYVGFGKPLILAEKAGASTIKNYKDIEAVATDFAADTEAYKVAAAIFAQTSKPKEIAIATYDPAGQDISSAAEAVEAYFGEDWIFLLTADADLSEQIAIADFIESSGTKFLVVQVALAADRNAFTAKAYDRTIVFYHTNADERADAALVGELGNQTVGSITWKFKSLAGITPIDVSSDELKTIHEDGAIAYVTKAGKPQTSEGIVASGEYIDVMHGKDWIKFNMESALQDGLANVPKVPYNDNGISLLEGQMTTVLQRAFNQGIIDSDEDGNPSYTVTAKPRSEMSEEERMGRKYNGLSFTYVAQGAIHEANIKGELLG